MDNGNTQLEGQSGSRLAALQMLIAADHPIEELAARLPDGGIDVEPILTLYIRDLKALIHRYLDDGLSSAYLEEWANLVECRDDLTYDPEAEEVVKQAVIELANPVLYGAIDKQRAQEILSTLRPR